MVETLKKNIGKRSKQSPKIKLRGLSKAFDKKVVLDKLDLDVFENESVVVIGGSGVGKSVLIKCVIGLLCPDEGSIEIDGEETTKLCEKDRNRMMSKFGFLFQGGALFDSLTVWENVAFFHIYNRNVSKAKAREIAADKIIQVGLDSSVIDLYPAQLSGGMQKRVAFARAIAHDPEVLFFDEPTTGLDPIMANVVNDLIIKAKNSLDVTTISITHDIESTRKTATCVAMLHKGKIVWTGGVKDFNKPKNKILAQFIHGDIKGPITGTSVKEVIKQRVR